MIFRTIDVLPTAVHDGAWEIPKLRVSRGPAVLEFYARYRSARKAFADNASECGTFLIV